MPKFTWYQWLILIVAIVIIFNPRLVRAHSEFHDWTAPDGETGCCNDTDCKVVQFSHQDDEGRLWYFYPGLDYVITPPRHVYINRLHSSGRPVACYDVKQRIWYCFSPGASG